jgi:dihydroorotase
MFDLVIRNGTLVHPNGVTSANIGISDGIIRAVATPGEALRGRDTIDTAGKLVLPGLIDAHVHIPGFLLSKELDNFETATKAAAAGGITTVMLMPTDDPRTTTPLYFHQKLSAGTGSSYVDFCIQAMVSPTTESVRELRDLGAVSFELFLSYGGSPKFMIGSDDYDLARTMHMIRDVDGIAGITPHSPSLNARLTEEHREDEAPSVLTIAKTRPILSEAIGISRACTVASEIGTRIHIRAVSTRAGIGIIRQFQSLARVSSEAMFHHLLFTAEEARRMGAYGVITPPIREEDDRAGLRKAIQDGLVNMVVSDHSPASRREKEKGQLDIWKSPPGMTGLQTLMLSMMKLIEDDVFSWSDLVRVCCEQPSRQFGLYPRKGALAPGSEADIVIIDPEATTLVRDEDQFSRADYTTLNGMSIKGGIERVLLRGNIIFNDRSFSAVPLGRFVRPDT